MRPSPNRLPSAADLDFGSPFADYPGSESRLRADAPFAVRPHHVMSVRVIAVAVLVFSLAGAASAGGAGITCARGYSYAGYQSSTVAYGISARITVLQPPRVSAGHVAAWIGVGGPGLGRGGS